MNEALAGFERGPGYVWGDVGIGDFQQGVVLEFKSAVKEDTTIMNAYTQLTVRYRRDVPDLFRYNAFIMCSTH